MSKGLRIGINGIAKNGKKGYIGNADIPKKIKKIYVGDSNDVAQLGFSGSEGVVYYGTATPLTTARYLNTSVTNKNANYLVCAGGASDSQNFGVVDAYSSSLTHSIVADLTIARNHMRAVALRNYVYFGGGSQLNTSTPAIATVDIYDENLSRGTPASLYQARYLHGAVTIADRYALFGFGTTGSSYINTVEIFEYVTTKLNTSTVTNGARGYVFSGSVGNYGLFIGGQPNNSTDTARAEAYSSSLGYTPLTNFLSVPRHTTTNSACCLGNYLLIGGGRCNPNATASDVVDICDGSLTRLTPTTLSLARNSVSVTSLKNYAIFAGGYGTNGSTDIVDVFDDHLVHSISDGHLSIPSNQASMASVGNYALYLGGRTGADGHAIDTVDVFEVS